MEGKGEQTVLCKLQRHEPSQQDAASTVYETLFVALKGSFQDRIMKKLQHSDLFLIAYTTSDHGCLIYVLIMQNSLILNSEKYIFRTAIQLKEDSVFQKHIRTGRRGRRGSKYKNMLHITMVE